MRVIAAAVLALCGGAAFAAPVTVRGGEHSSFTRIVLDLPARSPFEIDESGPVRIGVSTASDGFDLSEAMRKLNAGRVIGISDGEDATELLVTLGCECEIDAFFAGDAMLVIDISGEPFPLDVTRKRPVMRRAIAQEAGSSNEVKPADEGFKLPVVFEQVEQGQGTPLGPRLSPQGPTMSESAIKRVERQKAARGQILRQVSRGVSQGMLKPVQSLPELGAKLQEAEVDLPEAPVEPDAGRGNTDLNMRIVTSIDRDFVESRNAPLPASLGQSCADDKKFIVHGWTGDEEFAERVGRLRSDLFGEFDRINRESALQLAKTYIAYGFGLEALRILQSASLPAPDLRVMAQIVEGEATAKPMPAGWQPSCDTAVALWAYLGGARGSKNAPLNTRAVIAAYGALPVGLKAHLGASLAKRLEADGFEGPARQVLRLAQRGAVDVPAEVMLTQANLSETRGDMSEKKIREVIEANGAEAPRALISLIELGMTGDATVTEVDTGLAEAFAREYRRDPLGPRLERALSMALAQQGDHERSVEVLTRASLKLERDQLSSAADQIVLRMAQNAGDIEFLALAFDERVQALDLSASGEHAVARRLIDNGFSEQALLFLAGMAEGEKGRSRKILRAKAALELRRSRQVEAELLGLHGNDVEALRLSARLLRKDHQAARITLATQGKREEAAEQAWLGGQWEALRALGSESWTLEASLSEADTIEVPRAASIAAGRSLLATSEDLRTLVGDVLSKHQVTDFSPLD
ncbi:hypothetical protein DZK27_14180 [Rhodobacteraceae bacterium 63075]|nr:hypothetical protein DZK27_14180 [Rhodobacteraceae bacterium 63075]